jgi:hypothetical protein
MTKDDVKHILISIAIGACMAFFSTLFTALAEAFKAHSQQIITGGISASAYLFQKHIS